MLILSQISKISFSFQVPTTAILLVRVRTVMGCISLFALSIIAALLLSVMDLPATGMASANTTLTDPRIIFSENVYAKAIGKVNFVRSHALVMLRNCFSPLARRAEVVWFLCGSMWSRCRFHEKGTTGNYK